jgi:hypothetical protein
LEKKHVVENEVEEHVQLADFEEKQGSVRRRLENEHVVENGAEELVQLVDFEEKEW